MAEVLHCASLCLLANNKAAIVENLGKYGEVLTAQIEVKGRILTESLGIHDSGKGEFSLGNLQSVKVFKEAEAVCELPKALIQRRNMGGAQTVVITRCPFHPSRIDGSVSSQ